MLEDLLDSPAKLAVAIGLLSAVNFFVARLALVEQSRQSFVDYGDVHKSGHAASGWVQLAKPFMMTAIIAVFMFITDRFTRELLGGGWLLMQIGSIGSATVDVFALKALQRPDAADGHIRYSMGHRYRLAAASSLGMAIVAAIVAMLFGSWPFVMGAALILATGAGWYRRARQAHSRNPSTNMPD